MTLCEQLPGREFREASIPVLETKRLALRAPCLEDAKTVAMLANDRRIAENTARIPHPYTHADAENFIDKANKAGGETVFLITLRDRTIIGACGIATLEDAPEVGYWIGAPYWGQGYCTEALHAVIDYAFTDLDHEALNAGARVTNPASRRVLEKSSLGPDSASRSGKGLNSSDGLSTVHPRFRGGSYSRSARRRVTYMSAPPHQSTPSTPS